jgi:hypothetical protein
MRHGALVGLVFVAVTGCPRAKPRSTEGQDARAVRGDVPATDTDLADAALALEPVVTLPALPSCGPPDRLALELSAFSDDGARVAWSRADCIRVATTHPFRLLADVVMPDVRVGKLWLVGDDTLVASVESKTEFYEVAPPLKERAWKAFLRIFSLRKQKQVASFEMQPIHVPLGPRNGSAFDVLRWADAQPTAPRRLRTVSLVPPFGETSRPIAEPFSVHPAPAKHLGTVGGRYIYAVPTAPVGDFSVLYVEPARAKVARMPGSVGAWGDAKLCPTGLVVAAHDADASLEVFDPDGPKVVRSFPAPRGSPSSPDVLPALVACSPDGKLVARAGPERTTEWLDVTTGTRVVRAGEPTRDAHRPGAAFRGPFTHGSLEFTSDGALLVEAWSRWLNVYEVSSGALRLTIDLTGPGRTTWDLAPTAKTLVRILTPSGNTPEALEVIDVTTGHITKLPPPPNPEAEVFFDRQGRFGVIGAELFDFTEKRRVGAFATP